MYLWIRKFPLHVGSPLQVIRKGSSKPAACFLRQQRFDTFLLVFLSSPAPSPSTIKTSVLALTGYTYNSPKLEQLIFFSSRPGVHLELELDSMLRRLKITFYYYYYIAPNLGPKCLSSLLGVHLHPSHPWLRLCRYNKMQAGTGACTFAYVSAVLLTNSLSILF